ncbi:HXXEE domain-containing protein [Pyxidicoccus fallax]|uniref:HXXEE domain-containing protein n=1 Tax=Pyxidicoccus fallax TaxID=394095 RepID=A0A848LI20_9BACT|nr:HXXEE domain-containing protein [Pyxidicoccus fallax]NMO17088.1 HXXEE domain-containing protein [Pyxidicoccus fallax]NPC84871.1 HXXEE domain-containing protein [Pyxidicoccus fallax]
MTKSHALWLVPLLLTVHNTEEALWMHRVLPLAPERIPAPMRSLLPTVTLPQFLLVLGLVTVLPYCVARWGDLERERGPATYALLTLQVTMALNVLSHVGTAVTLGGYAPGLVTALLVNVPFSAYLFRRAARARWVRPRDWVGMVAVALVLHGPVLLGLMALAGRVTRASN